MDDDRESKWPAILFFLTSGLFFFGCVWYLSAGSMNPEYYWRKPSASSADQTGPGLMKNGRLLLVKDQGVRIDDERLVYRGIEDGSLVIDLFILALDPHYGYPHRIGEKKAQQGFSIGDYHFQLLAASGNQISLKRL